MAKAIVKKVSTKKIDPKPKSAFRSDAKQTATVVKAGRAGAANGIRASKALGLSIMYMQNGVTIKEMADGEKEIMGDSDEKKTVVKSSTAGLKKGMVLHAKK